MTTWLCWIGYSWFLHLCDNLLLLSWVACIRTWSSCASNTVRVLLMWSVQSSKFPQVQLSICIVRPVFVSVFKYNWVCSFDETNSIWLWTKMFNQKCISYFRVLSALRILLSHELFISPPWVGTNTKMASHLEVVKEMGWFTAGVKMLLFHAKNHQAVFCQPVWWRNEEKHFACLWPWVPGLVVLWYFHDASLVGQACNGCEWYIVIKAYT